MRATAESTRQHLGSINRTMTLANGALAYLRLENQSQTFTFEGMKTVARMRAALLASIDDGRGSRPMPRLPAGARGSTRTRVA
jgi:hypothetical protein